MTELIGLTDQRIVASVEVKTIHTHTHTHTHIYIYIIGLHAVTLVVANRPFIM